MWMFRSISVTAIFPMLIWINEPSGKWVDKDKPKLEVTLEADDDYYFKSGYAKRM